MEEIPWGCSTGWSRCGWRVRGTRRSGASSRNSRRSDDAKAITSLASGKGGDIGRCTDPASRFANRKDELMVPSSH